MQYAPFVAVGSNRHPYIVRETLLNERGWEQASCHFHSSPAHFAQRERSLAKLNVSADQAVPVDAFTWALGPAPNRAGTQVGGTPYWPAGKPWPQFDGKAATFLAQLNFEESSDLVPDLPGAVLALFVPDQEFFADEDYQAFWLPAGIEDLMALGDHPDPTFEFVHAHGVRFRTLDHPMVLEALDEEEEDEELFERVFDVAVTAATKVGGAVYDPQGNDAFLFAQDRFLGSLCSIQAGPNFRWPWANEEAPMGSGFDPGEMHHPSRELMLGDMGNINFFLDKEGKLKFGGSCA